VKATSEPTAVEPTTNDATTTISSTNFAAIDPNDFGTIQVSNEIDKSEISVDFDDIENLYASDDTLVETFKLKLLQGLKDTNRAPATATIHHIRIREYNQINVPHLTKLLADCKTFRQHQVYLAANKTICVQILDDDEIDDEVQLALLSSYPSPSVPIHNYYTTSSHVLLTIQKWERVSWSLGDKQDVLVSNEMKLSDIFIQIARYFGINEKNMLVLVLKPYTSQPLSDLNDDSVSKRGGARGWMTYLDNHSTLSETMNHLKLSDGDLILVQDSSEALKVLTPQDMLSVQLVKDASKPAPYEYYYGSGSSSNLGHYYGTNVGTSALSIASSSINSSGSKAKVSSGIKFKSQEERMKERLEKEQAAAAAALSAASSLSLALDLTASSTSMSFTSSMSSSSSGKRILSEEEVIVGDEREFEKQGGYALFSDIQ